MEVKLRAERKAGEFLINLKEKGELKRGNPQLSQAVTFGKLSDLGVERMESSRWQRIARIPEDRFEGLVARGKAKTQAAVVEGCLWPSATSSRAGEPRRTREEPHEGATRNSSVLSLSRSSFTSKASSPRANCAACR